MMFTARDEQMSFVVVGYCILMENSCQCLIISDDAEMFPKQVLVVKMIYAKYNSRLTDCNSFQHLS